jgi:nitroreductase
LETLEAIYKRRSIRDFKSITLKNEEIEILLKAAFSAPTAVNAQPWEFIVVTENEILDRMKEKLVFARYNAPTAIVVCGNMKLALKGKDKDLWIEDCSAAIENILIAATDIGIGSLWVGIYPIESRMNTVKNILNIPEYVVPLAMVYLGYPNYETEGRTRYNEKRIYWQTYDPERKHKTKDKPIIGHY